MEKIDVTVRRNTDQWVRIVILNFPHLPSIMSSASARRVIVFNDVVADFLGIPYDVILPYSRVLDALDSYVVAHGTTDLPLRRVLDMNRTMVVKREEFAHYLEKYLEDVPADFIAAAK